jgi:dTDP-4-dehydrorhamnose reductase
MRIDGRSALITGGGGQLASDLEEQLCEACRVFAPSRGDLDITDQGALDQAFERIQPEVVFNCAAFHTWRSARGRKTAR